MKRGSLSILAVCLLIFIASCGDDNNNSTPTPTAQPTISSFSPNQVSRGQQNVQGRIQGTNLGGVTAVNLGDGISVVNFSSVSSVEIEVIFNVQNNAAAGARTITITTSGGNVSSSAFLSVTNNRAPIAKFAITPASGAENTLFTVDATDSDDPDGQISKYAWDFGDGSSGTGRIADHKYGKEGTFEITLSVTDNDGAISAIRKEIQVSKGKAPIARFTITPPSGDINTRFTLDATGSSDDGRIVAYEWNLGDGTIRTGSAVTHTYKGAGGTFHVTLTVRDNTGLEGFKEQDLRVEKFNKEKAEAEIYKLVNRFFERFGKLERMDAEAIVEGWSTSPFCRGRDHELNIIRRQQQIIAETNVEVVSIKVLVKPSGLDGNAVVRAKFDWRQKNGKTGKSDLLHHFTVIFEDGEWQICNFQLENLTAQDMELFAVE
ncbi:MAG TPA: PKD domain-containing protein [Acidobacteriota bacterium]|nr:PKD domain-containing protein [Acidobacteriota bacterium]